ncbi:hypothetical protein JCM8097_005872 [Rhodosporidiobolus ruineniae]
MFRRWALVAGATGAVRAHMSPWIDSMYGLNVQDQVNPITPLGPGWDFEDWWFRGPIVRADPPAPGAVTPLPAGGSVELQIACGGYYTELYGNGPNGTVACDDPGPYHAGKSHPDALTVRYDLLAGCALGIADVENPDDATLENFTVFSVQKECVWNRNTYFDIPAKMPSCSGEWCICGWLWQPQTGAGNAYHTAFRCRVTNSPKDATSIAPPADPVYCGSSPEDCTKGAKRMLVVSNYPTNTDPAEGYASDGHPRYSEEWGFGDGAQEDIFLAASSTGTTTSNLAASSTTTFAPPSSTTTSAATTTQAVPSFSSSSTSAFHWYTAPASPLPPASSSPSPSSSSPFSSSTTAPTTSHTSLVFFPAPTAHPSASSSSSSSSSASTKLVFYPAPTATSPSPTPTTTSAPSVTLPARVPFRDRTTTVAPAATSTASRRLTFAERKALADAGADSGTDTQRLKRGMWERARRVRRGLRREL